MDEHVYRVVEYIGTSGRSIEDAILSAVKRASQTSTHIRWFEVAQMRGHVENGEVRHYQVALKIGFTTEEG